MMKKNKGFTLIELLAVIIILAIIALIATPIAINVIENSRMKAFKNSVYGVMEAYKLDIITESESMGKTYSFPEANNALKYTGTKMISGTIYLGFGKDIEVRLITDGIYCANGNKGDLIVKKGDCNVDLATAPIIKKASENSTTFLDTAIEKERIESIKIIMVNSFPAGSIDISEKQNGSVMLWTEDKNSNGNLEVYIGAINDIIYANSNSSYVFQEINNIERIDLTNFDTSLSTNMEQMFWRAGYDNQDFTLNLGNKFDTSKVTNMSLLFSRMGYNSSKYELKLGNKFDTSNVRNMSEMFFQAGYNSTKFTIELGNKFDTSKVTNMRAMFYHAGYGCSDFSLDLGDKFDTSKVTNMQCLFGNVGYSDPNFTLELGNKFDTSNATNMQCMFDRVGYNNTNFALNLGNKFNVDKAIEYAPMFYRTGYLTPNFKPTAQVKTQAEKDAILAKVPEVNVTIVP
jgi:bacterial surface protein 26-residue repeat/prepilin-type N-terminal cleavage/methylation domain